jgi:hypothetical protein
MHHGHADEGSISMLVHAGTLLLHESGYRERPPDGIYRSAVYHNRLVWAEGRQPTTSSLLEFLRKDGHYHTVQSERLYQTHLRDVQFSRIRVNDEDIGLIWDRSIIFLPELPCWIIVDRALATRTRLHTLSTLWWTTDILAQGQGWFETHIREVQGWQNCNEARYSSHSPVPGQQASPG